MLPLCMKKTTQLILISDSASPGFSALLLCKVVPLVFKLHRMCLMGT